MDERSRAEYRRQVTKMARRRGGSELEAAERLIAQARRGGTLLSRHIGSYLEPVSPRLLRFARAAYFAVMALFALLPPVLLFLGFGQILPALLALVPAMELSKNLTDFLFIRLLPPRHVPRLELSGGIPPEGRTLCVITALLTDEKSGPHFASLLEQYRLSNRDAGEELRFGLLCDLPDAGEKNTPQDERALTAAQSSVDALNVRYGGGFYLFLRARTLNLPDKRYMGWERKRGAILQLMLMLRGETGRIKTLSGEADLLSGIKYLITLDADTRLCAGSACQLVGAMLHPSNRPVIDKRRGIVTGGHAVLQPRISPDLKAAGRSLFSRITAGQGGIDPYGSAVSDIYHDLFGEGSFTGKGIIEVDAYVQCLGHRFPPDTILSHDLLEGAYLHCGLIGDVELTDGCPGGALAWFARLHRWIRGDWQTAPWLLRRVPGADKKFCDNPLGRLTKFKIMDNLRRSLGPVFILPAMGGALLGNSAGLLLSGLFALLCLWSGLLLSNLSVLWRSRFHKGNRYHSSVLSGWRMYWVTALVQFLLLPYHAYVSLNAAVTALYRMLVSKRRALQWVTAAQAESATEAGFAYYYGKMIVMLPAALFAAGGGTPWGIITACLWLVCPFAARYISAPQEARHTMSEHDRVFLLREAALMWDFFDTFLSPENHYLPPDNFQEQPATGQARRTSPTNIGLALLCILSALDLGLTRSGARAGADRALPRYG